MPTVLLPIQSLSLPVGTCYQSEQERLNDYAAHLEAILAGQSFYNYGDTKPDPANNGFPWFRTTDGRWYFYSGAWLSPVGPQYSLYERRIWVGSDGAALTTYDGGDGDAPSTTSGPMWEVDHDFDAVFPVGVGTFAGGTSVAVGGTGGEDEVTLTDAEVPDTQVTPLDSNNAPAGDKTVQKSGDSFGFSYQNGDFTGSNSGGRMTDILLKVNGGGDPHNNLPPFRGVYILKRTTRTFYKVP